MNRWVFILGAFFVEAALFEQATAAPITMICSDRGEDYSVYFKPSTKTLILDKEEGYFDPQKTLRTYTVTGVSPVAGGYRVVASGGEGGPHIIVYTGNYKKVDYTESDFGFVFATDECR